MTKIKAGDLVLHRPTGETWYIIGVNEAMNKVYAAGWPPTIADLSDCELVRSGNGITQHELEHRNKTFGAVWDEAEIQL